MEKDLIELSSENHFQRKNIPVDKQKVTFLGREIIIRNKEISIFPTPSICLIKPKGEKLAALLNSSTVNNIICNHDKSHDRSSHDRSHDRTGHDRVIA